MRVVKKDRKALDFSSEKEYHYHTPVLMHEVLKYMNIKPGAHFLDVTFGGGGHSSALLDADATVQVTGLDWDKYSVKRAATLQENYGDRLQIINGNFAHLYALVKKYNLPSFDGILADFGTSQFQIYERDGFSFSYDTRLDMRMSQRHYTVTAEDIVNRASEEELATIFWQYGEERYGRRIARAIVYARNEQKIRTTGRLADIVKHAVGSMTKGSKIHPATRVFQALRIVVNKELDNITAFLPVAFEQLKPGGRLLCISFHSLEDRLVKQFVKKIEKEDKGVAVVDGIVTPSAEEIQTNNASRSAKLRILEKKYGNI